MLNDQLRYDDETFNVFLASFTEKRGEKFVKGRTAGQLYGFFGEELFYKKYSGSATLIHVSDTDWYSTRDFDLILGESITQIDFKTFTKGSKSFTIGEDEIRWVENHPEPGKMLYIVYEHDAQARTFTHISMMNALEIKNCWNTGMKNSKFVWISEAKKYR